jgi:hypothetical protein
MAGRARTINIKLAASNSEVTRDAANRVRATQILRQIKKRQPNVEPVASKYTPLPLIGEKTTCELAQEGVFVA